LSVFPLNKNESGPHYWTVLFTYASNYPDNPDRSYKIETQNWIKNTISSFPCKNCVNHAFEFMNENPINLNSKEGLVKWLCALKNNANEDEHKPTIDCNDFYETNFNKLNSECTSCTLINKPKKTILKQSNNLSNTPKEDEFDYMKSSFYSSMWDKSPSKKGNFAVNNNNNSTMIDTNTTDNIDPNGGVGNNLTQTFPSLAYFDEFKQGGQGQVGQPIMMVQTPNGLQPVQQGQLQPQEQELDGILKPLDSLYTGPANFVGTKPSDFNLAYTPEFVANLYSLINQIFLTNFGSLLSISLASVSLFTVSVLAKNNLSYYDRLFLQNTIASIFFHAINYVNPRTKDEIIPMAQQFVEGLMSMDIEKMKKSLLYDNKNSSSGSGKDGKNKSGISDSMLQLALMDENLDPALKQKLILASRGGKHIDMEKMKEPRGSVLSLGSDMSSSFAANSIRDMQNTSMTNFDSGIGGPRAPGGSGGSGILNKSALESMFNARARYNSSSPTMRDYNMQKRFASPSVIDNSGLDSSYDYILDNALL
jgi:hypothetical protein